MECSSQPDLADPLADVQRMPSGHRREISF
jgi:hypothetical protein